MALSAGLAFTIDRWIKPRIMTKVAEKRNAERKKNNLPSFDDVEVWEAFIGAEETLSMPIRSADGRVMPAGVMDRISKPDDTSQTSSCKKPKK